jgi:hypothetical protein
VRDSSGAALDSVKVQVSPVHFISFTNSSGEILIPREAAGYPVVLSKPFFKSQSIQLEPSKGPVLVVMRSSIKILDTVDVKAKRQSTSMLEGVSLKPRDIRNIPTPFGDFNAVLATLGSIVVPSEFSGQYAVRGGNFDENLVYVNGMETYRPVMARTSQQDGLSFVNPDMVEKAEFSAGGWDAQFGDKLSSVLDVRYREPKRFKASATLSLLNASAHVETATADRTFRISTGWRYKSASYLIATLPVKGDYRPRFFDGQTLLQWQPLRKSPASSQKSDKLKIYIFSTWASNQFELLPQKQRSSFGTLAEALKLEVDFQGREILSYQTFQHSLSAVQKVGGMKLEYALSQLRSHEKEQFDVWARYALCQIQTNQNAQNFNECLLQTGSGSSYRHARNLLRVDQVQASHKGTLPMNAHSQLLWGISTANETFADVFSEYNWQDSANYIRQLESRQAEHVFSVWRHQGFVQWNAGVDTFRVLRMGLRAHWRTQQNQVVWSPRFTYSWRHKPGAPTALRLSAGLYQQPTFFREMRNREGQLQRALKAQSSFHLVFATDHQFTAWGRPFRFTAESYAKYAWNVIPYDMENLRLRYSGQNSASAYVIGTDFRLSGEFVKGDESWMSVGLMRTKENVEGDSLGWIRRPTDQWLTAGIFFQDHLPSNPSLKVYVNLVYGSGLPFGPTAQPALRQAFNGAPYRRVDIGFTKLISFTDKEVRRKSILEKIWIRAEVLNLLQSINTFSYTWIEDYQQNSYAVPNSLSSRFINIKLIVEL